MRFEVTEFDGIRRYKLTTDGGREYRQEYKMLDATHASMLLNYVDNKLVGKYIPCARMSDGIAGWYDTIGKRFLLNDEISSLKLKIDEAQYTELDFINRGPTMEGEKTDGE